MRLNQKIGLFSAAVVLSVALLTAANYIYIRKSTDDMYRELENSTNLASTSVSNLLNGSIENYLRGIAEKNVEILRYHEQAARRGEMTDAQARREATRIMLMQTIGTTGYLVAVEDQNRNGQPRLILAVHKHLPGGDCTALASCQGWMRQKNGYHEYEWLNPGDPLPRRKAAYIRYFEPYKWVIGATTFKDELTNLISLEDLRKAIGDIKINRSGYIYIIDGKGNAIVHPELQGQNVTDIQNPDGKYLTQEIFRTKNGKLTYQWQRQNETSPHERYAFFRHIPDLDWYIVTTGYTQEANEPANNIRLMGFVSLAIIALLAIVAVILARHAIVTPIRRLTKYVDRINEGHFDIPQAIRSGDEIGTLAVSFQAMARDLGESIHEREHLLRETTEKNRLLESFNEKLEQEVSIRTRELVRTEKLAALGSLVAGVAHELNTPIGNALLVASTLEEETRLFERELQTRIKRSTLDQYITNTRDAATIVTASLHRASELIASFKRVAVDQTSSQRRVFMLDDLVNELLITLRATYKKTPYRIESEIAPNLRFDSFPGPLDQILTNLIVNAVLHGFAERSHGLIRITGKPEGNDTVELRVSDNGCGIPPEALGRVFDPFFTTRLGQGGSGLGLSIVHSLTTNLLGGSIALESTVGQGTTVILKLPLAAPQHATTPWTQDIPWLPPL